MKKIFITAILYLLLQVASSAQVNINCQVNKDSVASGEDLLLSLNIEVDPGIEIKELSLAVLDTLELYQFLNPEDSSVQTNQARISNYEIKNYGLWKNSGSNIIKGNKNGLFPKNDKGKISNTMTLTFWATGDFLIFIDEVKYSDESKDIKSMHPDMYHARAVHVPIPEQSLADEPQLAPNKPNKWENWHLADFKWVFVAIAIILLAFWLIKRSAKRNGKGSKEKKIIEVKRPAHEIAFDQLDDLHKQSLWQQGKIKEYQSILTHIVREYLENRYGINALESTTGEILRDLDQLDLEKEDLLKLEEILQIADLVKFAKAKPEVNIHESFFQDALAFVRKTKLKTQNSKTD